MVNMENIKSQGLCINAQTNTRAHEECNAENPSPASVPTEFLNGDWFGKIQHIDLLIRGISESFKIILHHTFISAKLKLF